MERQSPPLIAPPGSRPRQEVAAQPADDDVQPETVPFRPPVLVEDAPGSRAPTDPDSMGALVLQLQQLQQEVMMLRGMVESQQHAIDRLEREQRERYLDLDRRLARGGSAAADPLSDPTAPLDAGPAMGGADERSAYEEAFSLTRERRFDDAIVRFRELIRNHPDGAFEANAWYWLGELYLAVEEPDLEASREAFVQVLERWPEHHKIPDTLYKLGVVYHQLGEPDEARRHLERARNEHGGSSAARLAADYIERL